MQEGDALLLASDGLWSVEEGQPLDFPEPSVLAHQEPLRDFIWQVIGNGGSDNVTAVMLWNRDIEP